VLFKKGKKMKKLIFGLFFLMILSLPALSMAEIGDIEQKLTVSDSSYGFGISVSISGDHAIAGDCGNGSAYIFKLTENGWRRVQKITPTNNDGVYTEFGQSVSISGNRAIVGAKRDDVNGYQSGSAYIFELTDDGWTQVKKLTAINGAANEFFGYSVSISGDRAIISDSGSAYIFECIGGAWTQITKLKATSDSSDVVSLGSSVSLSGDRAIVGAGWGGVNGYDYSGSAYIFELTGGAWTQVKELTPKSGSSADEHFGVSVSISGERVIVGAPGNNDNGELSGSAYVFERTGGAWIQIKKLNPTNGGSAYDLFGDSVSISGDRAMVGAQGDDDNVCGSGSVYVFERTGGAWTQIKKLKASDGAASDYFGNSVSISGDRAIIGAIGGDAVYGFSYCPMTEIGDIEQELMPTSGGSFRDGFGESVSISGNRAIVGANGYFARDDSAAYIFEFSDGVWTQTKTLGPTSGDPDDGYHFGTSVSISGDRAIIGAPNEKFNRYKSGSAYIFELTDDVWNQVKEFKATSDSSASAGFGDSVSISGVRAIVGSASERSAYIFELTGDVWNQVKELKPTSDSSASAGFGDSVSISGGRAIIGAYSNSAYIFELTDGTWTQIKKLTPSDEATTKQFGSSVCISGDHAIVGAPYDNVNGNNFSGSAYIFELTDDGWKQVKKLTPSDGATANRFGTSVSILGDRAIVGTHVGDGSGSAYIFEFTYDGWNQVKKLTSTSGGSVDDGFGGCVSISEDHAMVGALRDDENGEDAGLAYVFSRKAVTIQIPISVGEDVTITPTPEITIQLGNVTSSGSLSVVKNSTSPQDPPSNFQFATEVYNIEYTGEINPLQPVTVCINYDDSKVTDENNLKLLHWTNGVWEDITTSLDTDTNTLCGETVSFSPFVIAESKNEAPGDLDGNGAVDVNDYYDVFLPAFGTCADDEGYDPICNFDDDECVTLIDLQMLFQYYQDYVASVTPQ
jgi:hypothetical protein